MRPVFMLALPALLELLVLLVLPLALPPEPTPAAAPPDLPLPQAANVSPITVKSAIAVKTALCLKNLFINTPLSPLFIGHSP
jgi:hypothetical protein